MKRKVVVNKINPGWETIGVETRKRPIYRGQALRLAEALFAPKKEEK